MKYVPIMTTKKTLTNVTSRSKLASHDRTVWAFSFPKEFLKRELGTDENSLKSY